LKVTLDRTFLMPANADVTWAKLADIGAVASCLPGAKLTERIDDRHYKGTVTVKMGPATLTFRGDVEVMEHDATTRALRIIAKGTDTSGTSAASLDLTARVEAGDGVSCSLVGHSEATVSGKAATFGGRLMDGVADQILKQFAVNFAARVAAAATPPMGSASADPSSESSSTVSEQTAAREAPGPELRTPPTAPPAQPLNGIALLWAVIKDWLRGIFSKRPA